MSTFSDIYGYDTIKEHLQNAIKLDKVSHAYIINGGLGAGKKMIAKIFAKALSVITTKSPPVMPAIRGRVFLKPKSLAVFIASMILGPGV